MIFDFHSPPSSLPGLLGLLALRPTSPETPPSRTTARCCQKAIIYRVRTETESIMLQSDCCWRHFPLLDFEAWRALLRSNCWRDVEVTAA